MDMKENTEKEEERIDGRVAPDRADPTPASQIKCLQLPVVHWSSGEKEEQMAELFY